MRSGNVHTMEFEDNNPFGADDNSGMNQLFNQSSDSLNSDEPIFSPSLSPQNTDRSLNGPNSIIITEATKIREGSSRGHIAYTIRLVSGAAVRRRYSEFESLRKLLRVLFPCVITPSIPGKHSLGAYAANPTHAIDDVKVIELRRRALAKFLNQCVAIEPIHNSWALERFLDPNTSWKEFMVSEKVTSLPKSVLQAPPLDPANFSEAHTFLPIPSTRTQLNSRHSKNEFKEYAHVISSGLGKHARKINKHYAVLAAEYADFGGQLNSFSLDSHSQFDKFAPAVEKVGQAVDQGYILTTQLVERLSVEFTEPVIETERLAATAGHVLKYKEQRELQVQILQDTIEKQKQMLEKLMKAEAEAERMDHFLHANERINAATVIVQKTNELNESNIDDLIPSPTATSADDKFKSVKRFKLPKFSNLNDAIHGMIDLDPQSTRRNNITRTKESLAQNSAALKVAEIDLKTAAIEIEKEIKRYEETKKEDIRKLVKAFIVCHIEWAEKNLESWLAAKKAINES